jgi:prolipoprotein diacylglyceryltransferase
VALTVSHFIAGAENSGGPLYIMAAIAAAYAIGEGVGRLACISFGCCYGRPVSDCSIWLRKLFSRWAFVFNGPLKKACYEHGYAGQRLVPVQAVTAIISSCTGLAGIALFLNNMPLESYLVCIVLTQVWRFASEFLRADYRGKGQISAYQWMALAGTLYTAAIALFWPWARGAMPVTEKGLQLLWTPGSILFIEIISLLIFIRMGISTVTMSQLSFSHKNCLQNMPHEHSKPAG